MDQAQALARARALAVLLAEGASDLVSRIKSQAPAESGDRLDALQERLVDLAVLLDDVADASVPVSDNLPESPLAAAQALQDELEALANNAPGYARITAAAKATVGVWLREVDTALEEVLKGTITVRTGTTDGHSHQARVDETSGNGATDQQDGHGHAIEAWKLQEKEGHTHSLRRPREKAETTTVQTLIFGKDRFKTAAAAKSWAKNHNFNASKVDETDSSFRLRQREPGDFRDGSLRTITMTDGVIAVVGRLKTAKSDDIDQELPEITLKAARIEKREGEERFVMGVVLEPDTVDTQGDIYNASEVRKAAHFFMERFAQVGLQHKQILDGEARILESFLSRQPEKFGKQVVKAGTWLMGMRVLSNKLWEAVKKGDLTGFSIGGTALKRPVKPAKR